jgi:hypothetical protein
MRFAAALALATCFVYSGCTTRVTYEGTRLPKDEEVQLLGEAVHEQGRLYVTRVDGVPTPGPRSGISIAYMKPGRHAVNLTHVHRGRGVFEATTNLWFDALPGHIYQCRAERNGTWVRMWIEDKTTGETVGGVDENPPPLVTRLVRDR